MKNEAHSLNNGLSSAKTIDKLTTTFNSEINLLRLETLTFYLQTMYGLNSISSSLAW